MSANVWSAPLNKGDFTKTALPIGWLLFTLSAVENYNLSSKLPTKMHQLHDPASRTSFSVTITSCTKQQLYWNWEKLSLQSSSLQPPKLVDRSTQCLGYSLWQLLKISHWTLKNSMRCAKKCFFLLLAAENSGMPAPEICFLPGQFRLTIFPKENHGESLDVCELFTQPSNWEADTTTGLSPPQRNLRRQCLGVRRMLCAVGALLRNQRYEKKD